MFKDPSQPLNNEGLEEIAWRLASASHDCWTLEMTRRGWSLGNKTDEKKKLHSWMKPITALTHDVQRDYLQKARAMMWIIDHADFDIVVKAEEVMRLAIGARKNQKEKHK